MHRNVLLAQRLCIPRHLRQKVRRLSIFKSQHFSNRKRCFRCNCTTSGSIFRVNGVPFEDPRSYFSGARDLMINGFDLLEELSEVTIEASEKTPPSSETRTVAYFGSPGAFCETAAKQLYPNAVLHPMDSWGGTIEDMLRGNSDRALVPIENHFTKRTRILYDLICKFDMHLVDEVFMNIEHSLLVKPGTHLSDINAIASHIQGLFQCEKYIVENFPRVRLERMKDTALAAEMVANCPQKDIAAIASVSCANAYGLDVLQKGIQDRPDNITRFVVLAPYPVSPDPSSPSKTSILFSLPNDQGSGTLGQALEVFACENINLLWLDSRELHSPLIHEGAPPCHYLFYVNLEGSTQASNVKRALERLEEMSLFFRVIGSYTMKAKYLEDFFVPT
eukprot:g5743.t1